MSKKSEDVFRVAFMVEERRLGDLHRFLASIKALNVEGPVIVNQISADRPSVLALHAQLKGRKDITSRDIGALLPSIGLSASSSSYAIRQLREAGMLRPKGSNKPGLYDVISPKAKAHAKARG